MSTRSSPRRGPARFRMPTVVLTVGSTSRSIDLAQGRSPALLDPNGGDTTITLTLDPKAPAPGAGTLSLFFDMLTPPGLDPGWSPSLSPTQPAGPNPLTWLISINNATATALTKVQDGTNGLRRSGIVQLPIPAIPAPQPNTSSTCAVILRTGAAGWATPPRVTRLIPNVVSAVHSRPAAEMTTDYLEDQVKIWRRLPGNVIVLPESARPALANTLKVTIAESAQPAAQWQLVDDLGIYGPDDPVYVYDAVSARLRFGDGVAGRLPIPTDPTSVTVTYSAGGGTAGNLAQGIQWSVDNAAAAALEAWNVVPAAGGVDAETLDQVRDRAPKCSSRPAARSRPPTSRRLRRRRPEQASPGPWPPSVVTRASRISWCPARSLCSSCRTSLATRICHQSMARRTHFLRRRSPSRTNRR